MITTSTSLAPVPTPLDESVVSVDGLVKRYGDTDVVSNVSFAVRRGELFGLLGTNGAGKTTTVEILQGLRRSDAGTVRVLDLDPAVHGDRLRHRIGAQLQDAALPEKMRVGEALRLFAALHPAPRPTAELVDEWQLGSLLRRSYGALSGGERQRLFVALALIGRPEIVFLDELTQNLDPIARRHTWEVVRHVRDQGTTVVLVTHDVEEAERLCDRVVVMNRGRVVADGTPAAIVEQLGGIATVRFTDGDLDARSLAAVPGVTTVRRHGPEIHIEGTGPLLAHVGAHLVALGRPPLDLRVHHPSLEDRFVAISEESRNMTTTTAMPATTSSGTHARVSTVRTVASLTRMELRLLIREPGTLVGLIAFPAVTVLILAGVFGSTPDPDFGGVVPSEHYVVGYVGVVLASMGLVTLPVTLTQHRERGVLRRYRASGVTGGTLVASHVAVGAILGTVTSALVIAVGAAVYGIPAPADPAGAIAWFLVGLTCFIAIGGALGVLMPSSRAAGAIGNLIFVPMFLLGGGGPPREVMTSPMQRLSDVLPLSHLVGGLRLSWLGTTADPHVLLWPVIVTVVALAFAVRAARRRLGGV